MKLRWVRVPGLGCALLPLLLAGCRGELLEADGFRLRCDLGCGPDGPAILQGMVDARDSVSVWLQRSSPEREGAVELRHRPEGQVRIYSSAGAFERVDRRLTGGRYRDQRAFSHARSRSAHVLPEEQSDEARWARFGPGVAGPRLAIHEASHLAVYGVARDPQWPTWVAEGIAGTLEEQWAREQDGEDSWLHTRDYVRQVLLHRGELPGWDAILGGGLDGLPLSSRYAVWAGFMEVLLSPPFREATRDALATLAAAPPAEGWTALSVRAVFERSFPPDQRLTIENQFHEEIRSRSPRWLELARGSQTVGSARLQVAADGRGALLWHLPDSVDALDPVCLAVSGRQVGEGELALVLLLGGEGGMAEGVTIRSRGAPIPFSLQLGAELPDPEVPGGGVGTSVLPGGTFWMPADGRFRFSLEREGQAFLLQDHEGREIRWEAQSAVPAPGWGIGIMGQGGVLWDDIQTVCSTQDRG